MSKAPYLKKDDKDLVENLTMGVYLDLADKAVPAKIILEVVNNKLKEKGKRPVSKSYIDIIMARIHDKERSGDLVLPLDSPWSIGSCIKYSIPKEIIPYLTQMQKLVNMPEKITIRQARWFALLYHSVQRISERSEINIGSLFVQVALLKGLNINQNEVKSLVEISKSMEQFDQASRQVVLQLFWLYIIGVEYAKQERISDLVGSDHPETSELDNLYFLNADISAESFLDGLWIAEATSEQKKQRRENIANFKGRSKEELELVFGTLTNVEETWANDLLRAILAGWVSLREWAKKHPSEWSVLQKKMEAKKE